MGTDGGVRTLIACSEPLAARLSPARGPAAAKGESGMTVPRHPQKISKWTSNDSHSPVRQMRRSWRLRSLALKS